MAGGHVHIAAGRDAKRELLALEARVSGSVLAL